jgi:hypothetical protein
MILPVLAGSLLYGVTAVLQQRAARRVGDDTTDQAGLVRNLVRQRAWVVSTPGADLTGAP